MYIPILPCEEMEDPEKLIEQKKNLANCVCFVAARFLPGGNAIREKLMPSISELLQQKFPMSLGGSDEELATLQAFAVLYVYRPATTLPQFEDLTHWRLKSIVEAYAIHLGCHRSVNELQNLIRSRAPDITTSKSYKRYVMWLWLFTMAQHMSLVTGSPPTIREDASIRLAPEILRNVNNKAEVMRLLGEVELCLLWSEVNPLLYLLPAANKSQASFIDRGLAEWWCQIQTTGSERSVVLHDIDGLLDKWSKKWQPFISTGAP